MDGCIFCKIARHEAPATIDYETDQIIAFRSINQAAETHILIMPKAHIKTFMDLKEEVTKMSEAAKHLINKIGIQNEYKLVFNGGKFQSVPHVHWHLLGGDLENEKDVINKL